MRLHPGTTHTRVDKSGNLAIWVVRERGNLLKLSPFVALNMTAMRMISRLTLLALLSVVAIFAQETADLIPSVLLESVLNNDVSGITRALDAGEQIDLVNENGWSGAMIATATGRMDMLAALIEAGIDLNQPNNDGLTPLMIAANSVSFFLPD